MLHLYFWSPVALWVQLKTTEIAFFLLLKYAAQIFRKKYIECFDWLPVANQRNFYMSTHTQGSMTSQVPSRVLCSAIVWSDEEFRVNARWFTALHSIVTTMAKRWSHWASFSFLLTKNTARFGRRKCVVWTGSQTSTPGCVRPILNLTVSSTVINYSTH